MILLLNHPETKLVSKQAIEDSWVPIRRLIARMVDVLFYAKILQMMCGFIVTRFIGGDELTAGLYELLGAVILLGIGLWIPIEALLLSKLGTTPGKWCMGLVLRDCYGLPLTFSEASSRAAAVWKRGQWYWMGCGFPEMKAYHFLMRMGDTTWDLDIHAHMSYETVKPLKFCVLIPLVIWLLLF